MKTSKKVLIGAVVVAAAGVAGYFGYKKYKESQQSVARLGAFTDGYADYNAHVAAQYWKRQHELYNEKQRMAALRGY